MRRESLVMQRDTGSARAQSKGHVGTQQGGGHLHAKDRGLRGHQTYQHLELGLAASRTELGLKHCPHRHRPPPQRVVCILLWRPEQPKTPGQDSEDLSQLVSAVSCNCWSREFETFLSSKRVWEGSLSPTALSSTQSEGLS